VFVEAAGVLERGEHGGAVARSLGQRRCDQLGGLTNGLHAAEQVLRVDAGSRGDRQRYLHVAGRTSGAP
jgi:hypothetical protein